MKLYLVLLFVFLFLNVSCKQSESDDATLSSQPEEFGSLGVYSGLSQQNLEKISNHEKAKKEEDKNDHIKQGKDNKHHKKHIKKNRHLELDAVWVTIKKILIKTEERGWELLSDQEQQIELISLSEDSRVMLTNNRSKQGRSKKDQNRDGVKK